jgi:16S rRNA (adenine1518-N6/adenine1519-N6)-dimethyltransferase
MPLTPSGTRELLARLGHQPKRFLGQNFLVDGNIVRKSLELAGITTGDVVVEVGPGLGTLTSALLEAGAEVWAVEKDRQLHAHLTETLVPAHPNFHLLEGDAMDDPIAALPAERAQRFKIVANLPYAISTPWMDAVLSGPLPERMVLMLQEEAARRYVAEPGTKLFGAISIFLQSAYAVDPGHRVGAGCFHPRPDVESYLLNLGRLPVPFIFPVETKAHIRACFQQRRKQLGSILRDRLPAPAAAAWFARLEAAGYSAQSRAEQIPVALWREFPV